MLPCKACPRKLVVAVWKAALQLESVADCGLRHALGSRGQVILLDSMLTLQQGPPVSMLGHRIGTQTR